MKKIRYINKEIVNIENLEYEDHKISNNGLRCPKLNAHNIRAIHEYVVNQSSYSSGSGDDFVRKYFQQHRGDVSLASVITKVILIDTVDSTNLKQLLGKDYFKIVAQRIIDANLEEIIKNGDRLGDTFRRVASFPAKKDAKKEDLNLFVFFEQIHYKSQSIFIRQR